MDRKRLSICRKKHWHTFKVQDVNRKRRASLGLTTGVGSIFSIPSPSMRRRNVTSNSLGKTKTDTWSHCGEKRTSETSYHGKILRMKRNGSFQRLLTISKGARNAANEGHDNLEQENDQEVERDEIDSYNEVIFGRRRPDSIVVDWTNQVLFVLEFKRTSDQQRDYRERGASRAMTQHDIFIRSLEKVAGDAEGENGGWKIKLIIFVGHKWISARTDS
jgi:hypothetical protein